MKVAIEGCCHGELDIVYQVLQMAEERSGFKIDLLICCGDFQAMRDCKDLNCMAAPPKYRLMQSFYKYYSGEKKAPFLTIFIGGNHEASNHLSELGYGGWVAPNIYFLGNAGVVRFGGLRIAGISGIYYENHYRLNRFEFPPYTDRTERSTYHTRLTDVFRLKQLTGPIDMMLSHDWPLGIYRHGQMNILLRLKPHLEPDMRSNRLGNPAAMELLQYHKPTYWFAGHMHVKFAAIYYHDHAPSTTAIRKDPDHTHSTGGSDPTPSQKPPPLMSLKVTANENSARDGVASDDVARSGDDVVGNVAIMGDVSKEGGDVTMGDIKEVDTCKDKDVGMDTKTCVEDATSGSRAVCTEEEGEGEGERKREKSGEMSASQEVKEPKVLDVPALESQQEGVVTDDSGGVVEKAAATSIDSTSAEPEKMETQSPREDSVTVERPTSADDDATATPLPGGDDIAMETAVPAEEEEAAPVFTKFLALDKPIPGRRFLQILDIPSQDGSEGPYQLEYDKQWLAILKSTESLMRYNEAIWLPPSKMIDDRVDFTPTEEELRDVEERFQVEGCGQGLVIPENFAPTVPPYKEGDPVDLNARPQMQENPQTTQFCEKLGITNPFKPRGMRPTPPSPAHTLYTPHTPHSPVTNPDEIELSEDLSSPDKTPTREPDGFKGSLGEGLLEWQVDSRSEASAAASVPRQPLHLPPPAMCSSRDGGEPAESEGHMEEEGAGQRGVEEGVKSISIREGVESRDEKGVGLEVGSSGEGKEEEEEEECKSGVKRPLPPSPQLPCEEGAASATAAAGGSGPEIKRRNLALYSESASGEPEQEQ